MFSQSLYALSKEELAILALIIGSYDARNKPPILKGVMKLAFLAFNTYEGKLDFKYFDDVPFVVYDYGVFSKKVLDIIDKLQNYGFIKKAQEIVACEIGIKTVVHLMKTERTPTLEEVINELRKKDPELAKRVIDVIRSYGKYNARRLEEITNKLVQISEITKTIFYGVPVKQVFEIRQRARELVEQGEASIEV